MDKLSKSDPFVVVKIKTDVDPEWLELGRTEIVSNTQDPFFTTQLSAMFLFEEVQHLRFEVYDADCVYKSNASSAVLILAKQDFQGSAETTVASVLGSVDQTLGLKLDRPRGKGSTAEVFVRMEEVAHQHDLVTLKLRAAKVDKKDLTSSDPFLRISRALERGEWVSIFKTEVKNRTLNPVWRPIQGSVQRLVNGDLYRPLRFDCWDYDLGGGHDFIGSCEASIIDLQVLLLLMILFVGEWGGIFGNCS
ncbi:unnamed protein product [Choristocarpus tenellus]